MGTFWPNPGTEVAQIKNMYLRIAATSTTDDSNESTTVAQGDKQEGNRKGHQVNGVLVPAS